MELAAEDGRAQRDRSYLRILAPPPTFSVSVSGAELRAAARRSRFPYYPAIHARPPTALCVLGCPWTALHLSFINTLFTRHSRRALARSQPQLLQLLIWVPFFIFGPPLSPFFSSNIISNDSIALPTTRTLLHCTFLIASSTAPFQFLLPGINTWFWPQAAIAAWHVQIVD
ncbi:uncharacterized protein BO87DRAFT_50821 [Aspergillus neoniger CBS 115656]|uniref:Uncharacterized protein n=1 Tax=Aspergillus neoniger (strain CBS 115656) TaxID=1448310 RepID=A0A318YJQ4_ASPNB|nr:hypothetical protein BO87DRAFT_50821 [Aspergillus neoniger CBS 115656]PYH34559.1 hypothetical protein BO87DRAFT_50821 [Aspergillus neoniger CBS 115656]